MCGITGYIHLNQVVSENIIQQMTDALIHRGPDDGGIYISENKQVALGHRRLSFLDLSEKGKQPMLSYSEQQVITLNGEIYNFNLLREELKFNYPFQSESDTEVVLAAYQKWGIEMLHHLEGMFAFALLDEAQQKMFLVRDRFGIKPLYYTVQNQQLCFASELKAIHATGIFSKELDVSSFADYFVYRYIPSPKTIWKNFWKLPPAHYLEIDLRNLQVKAVEYWGIPNGNQTKNQTEMVAELGELIQNSVKQHVVADVPIGSFLSGGYDSSALVHYMCNLGQKPSTFSIGFDNWQKSEDQFAQQVAQHLGVLNESVIANEESLKLVDKMAQVYDEPIADISIVPTYMVSQLARKKVKAVVSGEGADELFGGYTWQHDFFRINYPSNWKDRLKKLIKPKRDTVDFYAQAMAMGWFDRDELKRMMPESNHQFIPDDVHWFYRKNYKANLSPFKSIQQLDIKCFMGELVLTKIDRASMANSLEVRVPFLHSKLFEYVFNLSEKKYIRANQTKFLLYENIKKVLPKSILARKKQGFVGPDAYYMNLEWYRNQFKNSKLVELNLVKQTYINDLLKENYNWKLWKLLIMEKWLREWID